MTDGERLVVVHAALVSDFEAWLAARGLELKCVGVLTEGDMPTWITAPTDRAFTALDHPRPTEGKG
jgi:hypothetical protein